MCHARINLKPCNTSQRLFKAWINNTIMSWHESWFSFSEQACQPATRTDLASTSVSRAAWEAWLMLPFTTASSNSHRVESLCLLAGFISSFHNMCWRRLSLGGRVERLICVHVSGSVYLMMSICPFLAARWRGDVPLGSVVSPFFGSSKAAHMLLDKSSCTTWSQRRGGEHVSTCLNPAHLRFFLSEGWKLPTPTLPNSQARSRGVFPALSTMQGLDWCCSSISDCRQRKHRREAVSVGEMSWQPSAEDAQQLCSHYSAPYLRYAQVKVKKKKNAVIFFKRFRVNKTRWWD